MKIKQESVQIELTLVLEHRKRRKITWLNPGFVQDLP